MNYILNCFEQKIQGEITLPSSKSISNRLLIIKALAGNKFNILNLSDSDDTTVMTEAFLKNEGIVNIGHAGTSMRFLTAYYAATSQKKVLTGSERMKNRPIRELVDGLNQLGAAINYVEKVGFPPIQTSGNQLQGSHISISGSISSQFITALLLIAPVLPKGLTVNIKDKLISSSYVNLTLQLMKVFGVHSQWQENTIVINPQQYKGSDIIVEADWSGASYWYEMAALTHDADIILHGLTSGSLQGDAEVARIFEKLGVRSTFLHNSVRLTKDKSKLSFFEYDFLNNPDLVQTLVVTLCLSKIPFRISGADTLRVKETDRIAALQKEMSKLGFIIKETAPGVLAWDGQQSEPDKHIIIDTYKDHRMALAFAPAAIKMRNVLINEAMVITKSYPNYWEDLIKVGFEIKDKID
jgi:3-phosphoshikimate 1-carboxyvinyltransferase